MGEELEECPFCGGGCCVCEYRHPIQEYARWQAHCMDCGCVLTHDDNVKWFGFEEEAITAWNTRKGE